MKEFSLRPFRHVDTDLDKAYQWVLAPSVPVVKSCATILESFYDLFRPDDPHPYQPLAWRRDPEKEGRRFYPNTQVMLAAHRRDFFVVAEKCFVSVMGPHSVRLLYRLPSQEMIWIAIAQVSALFHSDDRLQEAITQVVQERLFWHSPQTAKTMINIV